MDPYSEERLTEEVLHLHTLWRRGPPRNPKPIHNHSSTVVAAAANRNPSNKRPTDPKNRNNKKKKPRLEPRQDSGPEWPCPEPVQNQPSTSSGWPPIEPVATPAAHPVSSEERANLAALQLQYKGSDACRGFFARNADSGSDEEGEEEEANGEMMESEEYKFFLKLFVENDELRGYYEKNCESGLFCCLVCGGMRKRKFGKKFKNCVGLVQHSISISRTKKKRAHRAFGQVVCRVFGWDIDRLPTIVLKGEPLSRSLADSGNLKPEENHVAKEHDSGVQNENVAISIDDINKKNEVVYLDGKKQKLEEERTAEDPTSNSKDLISGKNDDACKVNDVKLQAENTDNSVLGMEESNAEMDNLPSNVLQVPESILKACKEFCAAFFTSMSDNDVSENNLIDGEGVEEREEFKFFLKLFTENESLRRYYENNYDDGEFFCLACGGAGKKMLKSFKTCGRLLQHTTSLGKNKIVKKPVQKPHIAKMLKMKMVAHRACSFVICKVLGWDIEKLPAVVLKGEPLGRSLTKTDGAKLQDESVGNSVDNTKEDDSTKINKMQEESVGNAVDNMDDIVEDDSTKVNQLQGKSAGNAMGNMNDLDGVKETDSMKVDSNGEATDSVN
ncbi:uncharacterized protein LOC120086655 isoform X3 [Benincasa hispida]|uniref:uncharacterized protein LOC120086655 isoform X3 n=1 Tax=Benincasa hispida TaxID=102211 RepID=UPI001901E004|nr:uncharacterized protein LOC120086655 isoform X3 [Benincasa hispida]